MSIFMTELYPDTVQVSTGCGAPEYASVRDHPVMTTTLLERLKLALLRRLPPASGRRQLSRKAAAEHFGIGASSLARIVGQANEGQSPTLELLEKIAAKLDVRAEFLLLTEREIDSIELLKALNDEQMLRVMGYVKALRETVDAGKPDLKLATPASVNRAPHAPQEPAHAHRQDEHKRPSRKRR